MQCSPTVPFTFLLASSYRTPNHTPFLPSSSIVAIIVKKRLLRQRGEQTTIIPPRQHYSTLLLSFLSLMEGTGLTE